jgi:aminoglycoside phosphotransferase family enzyme
MLPVANSTPPLSGDTPVSLDEKLCFLSAPENFGKGTKSLEIMQTHHAWLFFTDRLVFKMKKPFQYGRIDYSSLEARHHMCNEEYRLNRRLAKHTYLGVVPLVINRHERLELDAEGRAVEWLVKMRRLPQLQMLHIAAPRGMVCERDIRCLMQKLLRFYRQAPVIRFAKCAYTASLRERLAELRRELLRPRFALAPKLIHDVTERQAAYIDEYAHILEERQGDGNVREIHGDLRPEHVCFLAGAEPEIIDCLEFDPDLRRMDCVEELAFFGMECRHMGLSWIERQCIDYYRSRSGDSDFHMHLWNFYAALRATTRAVLSAWHLLDSKAVQVWTSKATDYLGDARHYIGLAGTK